MAFLVSKLPLPFVPCFCTVLLLICSLLSCSLAKSCKCSGSGQDQFGNFTMSLPFDQTDGLLFGTNPSSSDFFSSMKGLGSFMKTNYPAFNLSDNYWFFFHDLIDLWETNVEGTALYEASFSFVFSMSIYQQKNQMKANSSLILAIRPAYHFINSPMSSPPNGPSNPTSSTVAGSHVSVQISTIFDPSNNNTIWVQIDIESPGNSSVANKYRVWIDYDHVGHRMSLYVDAAEGTPKPLNAIANTTLNISGIMSPSASLGFFSSMGQLQQLDTWNLTINKLPDFHVSGSQGKGKGKWTIILSSVLGSVAATAITAAVVYWYFNSKYRRWTKEQEKLAKIMQGLPGVLTQVDYADIRKATKNFHETMKLGKGGFGAVYRCTLPAAAAASSRTGRAMEVAVKKFMREVEDRRYNDFLAEVSIINRLRHKNIVPLVGWSYNKGEPLLVYEYMTNGSLDQHLFRGGGNKQQQQAATGIQHWDTRYGIARDIATGLHYVHHEHEPMVLHRDIKASNIMLDSTFRARLGDFGIAYAVAADRSSVTGVAGTMGYIAPDYVISHKATRQSDTYAFGVLILEIVTGKTNGDVPPDDDHITDWVWRLRSEGKLLQAVDAGVLAAGGHQMDAADEAKRLLLLGLACTNPNPFNRPSMVEVVQVINKLVPPPDVPLERPRFLWPPEDWRSRNSVYSTAGSNWDESSASSVELVQVSQKQPSSTAFGGTEKNVAATRYSELNGHCPSISGDPPVAEADYKRSNRITLSAIGL